MLKHEYYVHRHRRAVIYRRCKTNFNFERRGGMREPLPVADESATVSFGQQGSPNLGKGHQKFSEGTCQSPEAIMKMDLWRSEEMQLMQVQTLSLTLVSRKLRS